MDTAQLASIRLETLKLAIQILIRDEKSHFDQSDVLKVAESLEKFINR